MKTQQPYSAPAVAVVEVATENGIAQSGIAPGTTGQVNYDPEGDHYEF